MEVDLKKMGSQIEQKNGGRFTRIPDGSADSEACVSSKQYVTHRRPQNHWSAGDPKVDPRNRLARRFCLNYSEIGSGVRRDGAAFMTLEMLEPSGGSVQLF